MHAELRRLSPCALRRYLRRLRWLLFCEACARLPAPIRLGLVHTAATFGILLVAPPPGEISPVFIPLAWAGSLAFSTGVLGVQKLYQFSLERGK